MHSPTARISRWSACLIFRSATTSRRPTPSLPSSRSAPARGWRRMRALVALLMLATACCMGGDAGRAPNVEGVVLLHQGDWPPDVVETFHKVPWLDAASIRLKWSELEPRDQEFNWAPFDKLLAEVKKYNAAHPGARRTLHIRPMAGVHCPRWFEQAGVRFYDTTHRIGKTRNAPIHVPVPYDNPEFLKQLRQLYRAMFERYHNEPLVTVYHGTWSAGPWDEIFHPQAGEPLPPDYTPDKFVRGMVEQLDVLIEEFCLKGNVAELPYSGKYPPKDRINITGPLTARIVERLGHRTPYLYIQSNGWGKTSEGKQTVSWGHERDIADVYGQVNLAFQALGTNKGGGWFPQGDWIPLIELAKQYEAAYVEIYPPDLMPLDTAHHIVEAFTDFRQWLKQRNRASRP
ncbi:MAG: hypothetical protein FJ395_16045 [Verrucomicrobia bacterium]|nr:hypothetical protein [Verrucomicrobiota bacterium]